MVTLEHPFEESLTFDDVLIKPAFCNIRPEDIDLSIQLGDGLRLNMPILSAAMDTVTEAEMAIAMAQLGGMGVIHRNMPASEQVQQVELVKRFVAGMVTNPVVIEPEVSLQEALDNMVTHRISALPVVNGEGHLVGILTNRDVRFASDVTRPVSDYMTRDNLVTVKRSITREEAKHLLHKHRIEKLLVVDDQFRCAGLITVKDIEKAKENPLACIDARGHLCVAAAVAPDERDFERAMGLIDAGVDMLVIDTAHGHSAYVLNIIQKLRQQKTCPLIVAGNIATSEAARCLIEAGADVLKVGIGPGSICTTRVVAGVGVPQLSAIMAVAQEAGDRVPIIADGGIKQSGDVAKALAAGARAVMLGSLLAGTDESPGQVYAHGGLQYKLYRGMGSLSAMVEGSASRYGQDARAPRDQLTPEGVEGRVPYKGSVKRILQQLVGGIRACMRYTGADTLETLAKKAQFIRISHASLRESHVHDVEVIRDIHPI